MPAQLNSRLAELFSDGTVQQIFDQYGTPLDRPTE
jgi:hypothetical protein